MDLNINLLTNILDNFKKAWRTKEEKEPENEEFQLPKQTSFDLTDRICDEGIIIKNLFYSIS